MYIRLLIDILYSIFLISLHVVLYLNKTRASAQRVTNTPGLRHFLIIKYFKVNDNDIKQDIVYNVSL